MGYTGCMGISRRLTAVTLALGVVLAAASCSSDDDSSDGAGNDQSKVDRAEQLVESAGARGLGEALRLFLLADDAFDEHPREVRVLRENVDDLPGTPIVSGIEDTDGDGLDDDGNLETHLNDEVACVSVSTGGRVDVHGGAC
jgi:hypothetical protein